MREMGGVEGRDTVIAQLGKSSHKEVESCPPGPPRDSATGSETKGWSFGACSALGMAGHEEGWLGPWQLRLCPPSSPMDQAGHRCAPQDTGLRPLAGAVEPVCPQGWPLPRGPGRLLSGAGRMAQEEGSARSTQGLPSLG